MASNVIAVSFKYRLMIANVLSILGWLYMSLLAAMLVFKGITHQLTIPVAVYVGIASSLGALLAAAMIVGTTRSIVVVGSIWLMLGLLAGPFVATLSWAAQENRLIAICLVGAMVFAACYRMTFRIDVQSDLAANH